MKSAFTLIEMLLVIGIIAVLTGASITGYSSLRKSAERARAQEVCLQVKTALEAIYSADGIWPQRIITESLKSDSKVDENIAYIIARYGLEDWDTDNSKFDVNFDTDKQQTIGLDRFGILDPWGAEVVKRRGTSASLGTPVGKATVEDHILRFKVDVDGDGIIKDASVGGESVDVRATVIVWCCGKDGKMEQYSKGLKSDDVYTWTPGQTRNVK